MIFTRLIKYIFLIVCIYPICAFCQNAEEALDRAHGLLLQGYADSSVQIIRTELQKAQKAGNLKAEVHAMERLAVWHLFTGRNAEGLNILNEAITKAEKLPDSMSLALLLGNRAYELAQNNRFEDAIRDVLRAQDIFLKSNDTLYVLNGYNAIGYIFSLSGQPEKAEPYYLKELEMARSGNYKKELSIAYDNLAILYAELDRDPDLIHSYHLRSLKLATEINDAEGMASGNSNLANHYLKQGRFDSAEWHGLKAVGIASEIGYIDLVQEVQLTLSSVYLAQARFQESVRLAGEVLRWARENGNVDHQTKALGNLAKGYSSIGKYDSAYAYLSQLKDLEDSLKSSETLRNIQELETKYETSKKELTIARAEAQLRKRNMLIAVFGLLLVLSLSWFVAWRRAALQRVRLKDAQINQLQQKHEIDVLNSLVEGEEKERSRIAKELHDGVNGLLSALKLNLERSAPELIDLADQTMHEVRNISHNLMPANLIRFGLPEALRDYVDQINQSGKLQVDLQCIRMEERLRRSVELSVYRIVQELMNNVIRHSEATEALIQLSREDSMLHIVVEDNGKGFSPSERSGGIGMQSLSERLRALNGTLEFDSGSEMGTSVYVEIRLDK